MDIVSPVPSFRGQKRKREERESAVHAPRLQLNLKLKIQSPTTYTEKIWKIQKKIVKVLDEIEKTPKTY